MESERDKSVFEFRNHLFSIVSQDNLKYILFSIQNRQTSLDSKSVLRPNLINLLYQVKLNQQNLHHVLYTVTQKEQKSQLQRVRTYIHINYMILQQQLKNHIKTHFLSSTLNKIIPNYDPQHGLLTIVITLDLVRTLRQAKDIASFIVGNFPQFCQLTESSLFEMMEESNLKVPAYGVNISFHIQNCSLPRHNLESNEFLSSLFQQGSGILVYLKDSRVLAVSQPEFYLSSWAEVWENTCKCEQKQEIVKRRQRLVDIVKSKTTNLKQSVVPEILRCNECHSKLKFIRKKDQTFINCQKIKVLTFVNGNSEDQIFNKGQLDIFLDHNHISKLNEGETADLCIYFTAEPFVGKASGDCSIKVGKSAFLVSAYPPAKRTSLNSTFFSGLTNLSCEYIHCSTPRNTETVVYNFKKLTQTINRIKFPYLQQNTLTLLKMSALNSLFNHLHQDYLHMLIVTEEMSFVEKALKLEGILIKKWPSFYDYSTLLTFFSQCHNAIILVSNPGKKQNQYINQLLDQKIMKNVNFTLWIVAQPSLDLKKELNLQKIQIFLDLSVEKNFNICQAIYDDMLDQRLECFVDHSDEFLTTAVKDRRQGFELEGLEEISFEGIEQSEMEIQEEAKVAEDLLENYFLRAREYKYINSRSLKSIRKVASGFAALRGFLRSKGAISAEKPQPNVLDSILAIFMEEESGRNRYSSSNTLFSNEISKLMLNEENCELSFWNYEFEEGEELGETKRVVRRETMFKSMVTKLVNLVYNNEAW